MRVVGTSNQSFAGASSRHLGLLLELVELAGGAGGGSPIGAGKVVLGGAILALCHRGRHGFSVFRRAQPKKNQHQERTANAVLDGVPEGTSAAQYNTAFSVADARVQDLLNLELIATPAKLLGGSARAEAGSADALNDACPNARTAISLYWAGIPRLSACTVLEIL